MVEIKECSRCSSTELTYKEQYPVFNPDTDEEELHDCWICDICKTVHVSNNEYAFYMIEINTNKAIQTTDCNITSTWEVN